LIETLFVIAIDSLICGDGISVVDLPLHAVSKLARLPQAARRKSECTG
jgi:hypothetical protein